MTALTWLALVLMAAGTLAWVLAPLFGGRGRGERFVPGATDDVHARTVYEEIELAVARLRRVDGGKGDEP